MNPFSRLLALLLPCVSIASAQGWEVENGINRSLTSDLRIYAPVSLTVSLGDIALWQAGMEFSAGGYVGSCTVLTFQGVMSDSIVFRHSVYQRSTAKNVDFLSVSEQVLKNPEAGSNVLLNACLASAPVTTQTLYVPKTWGNIPLDLRGLNASFTFRSDNRLLINLKP